MKLIDLEEAGLTVEDLLSAVRKDDLILRKGGHVLARVEQFGDEDWDDWLFEHSPEAVQAADARRQCPRPAERISIEALREELKA